MSLGVVCVSVAELRELGCDPQRSSPEDEHPEEVCVVCVPACSRGSETAASAWLVCAVSAAVS